MMHVKGATYRVVTVDCTDLDVAAAIERLHAKAFPNDKPVATGHGFWWVVQYKYSDEPVAFGGLWPSVRMPMAGYLCRAGVAQPHRGQGLQCRLIAARLRKARSLGWTEVVSDTIEGNVTSANNLIKCGFRMFTPEKPWASSGSAYWRKEL